MIGGVMRPRRSLAYGPARFLLAVAFLLSILGPLPAQAAPAPSNAAPTGQGTGSDWAARPRTACNSSCRLLSQGAPPTLTPTDGSSPRLGAQPSPTGSVGHVSPQQSAKPGAQPAISSPQNFTVPSTVQWLNTGFVVNQGDPLSITASGSWNPGSGWATVGPDGEAQDWGDNFLNLTDIGLCSFCATTPAPHYASLIGYIGANPPPPAATPTPRSSFPRPRRCSSLGATIKARPL